MPYIPVLEPDLRAAIAIMESVDRIYPSPSMRELIARLKSYLTTNPDMSWPEYVAYVKSQQGG
jgi:hypothetical protein